MQSDDISQKVRRNYFFGAKAPGAMLALLFLGALGCEKRDDYVSPTQRIAQWHRAAEPELLRACTNDIVGFSRLIRKVIIDNGDDPNKWTASVTAEYVNKVGGIERTNADFKFRNTAAGPECMMDLAKVFAREKERMRVELSQDIDTMVRLKVYTAEKGEEMKRDRGLTNSEKR